MGRDSCVGRKNGGSKLLSGIPDGDFYYVEKPTNYTVGPLCGPMYQTWDYDAKDRPTAENIGLLMHTLISHWPEIVGNEIANATRPLALTVEPYISAHLPPRVSVLWLHPTQLEEANNLGK